MEKIISKLLHSNRRINNGLKTVKLWLLVNIIFTWFFSFPYILQIYDIFKIECIFGDNINKKHQKIMESYYFIILLRL